MILSPLLLLLMMMTMEAVVATEKPQVVCRHSYLCCLM
jgi:hypothetical protein